MQTFSVLSLISNELRLHLPPNPRSRASLNEWTNGGASSNLDAFSVPVVQLEPQAQGQPGTQSDPDLSDLVGSVDVRGQGGGTAIVAVDFSPIGSSQVRVEVYHEGNRVGSKVTSTGDDVARITPEPDGTAEIVRSGASIVGGLCIYLHFDRRATITPTDGDPLVGNEVRFCAVEPDRNVAALGWFQVSATGITFLQVLDEIIVPLSTEGPELNVQVVEGIVVLSWEGEGFTLQSKISLDDPWLDSNLEVAVDGNQRSVTLVPDKPVEFFQLRGN